MSGAPKGKPRLLVVDDQPLDLRLVVNAARLCGQFGAVEAFADGPSLCERARALAGDGQLASTPTLVLADLHMPHVDGVEVTRRLKAEPATQFLPVVILTSSPLAADRTRAEAAGCDDYFEKPAAITDLVGLMTQAADRAACADK
jgi:CheY-like chemotaxis protein